MKHFHFTRIDSTNDVARSLIENEQEIIVSADEQSKGRGRMDRAWYGDFGKNLYLTYSVNHLKNRAYNNMISYLAAVSIFTVSTFRYFAPEITFKIKYPNDIYAFVDNKYKKVAGILSEHVYFGSSAKFSIIGIGANIEQTVFPDEISEKAASLAQIGSNVTVHDFSKKLISYFETMYNLDENKLLEQWKSEINISGKDCIFVSNQKKIKIKEHLDDGRLLLADGTNELIIDDGESIIYDL